jgi:subtilisin family serine protease
VRRIIILFLIWASLIPGPASADVFDPDQFYEIIVELDSGIDPLNYGGFFLAQLDVPVEDHDQRINHIYKFAINGFSVYLTLPEYEKAGRLGLLGVHSLTESLEVSIDPITNVEGQMPTHPLDPDKQVIPTGILRAGAAPDGQDYSSVDVAVIDTGIDKFHPDLNVVGGVDCVAGVDEAPDFGYDGYGHGTHVAGTIGARDNGIGVVGVAPNARLWSVKVLDNEGFGTYASVICGLDYVAEWTGTIEVANMSLGGYGFPSECGGLDPMHNAICVVTEQTIVAVSAGNSSADSSGFSPANYPEVVTVSAYADFDGQPGGGATAPQDRCYAMSVDDELAAFSNYGAAVDIAAPGTCILSTVPSSSGSMGGQTPLYGIASGTSMASPHVTGCVAKYLAANPDQREWAVRQILMWSEANSDPVKGDHDGIHEPLLVCDAVPRYQGSDQDYDA